ncbi:hypothetical protein QF031_003028 [Pseudarthrobacter defluvii]|nr:hypothetical protein [Pseudarthrobacter defluvii]
MTTATRVTYETRSVKTVRGLEARTRAKLEQEGWEFLSQEQGKVRSDLTFRRPKPPTPWKLIGAGGVLFAFVIVAVLLGNAFGSDNNSKVEAVSPTSQTPSQSASAHSGITSVVPSPTSVTTTPAAAPPSAPLVSDTTVDELLDRLNSAQMGGIKVGDRFQLTGELFMSDLWMTGAAGEYTVMLKAQGGAQDLSVFVDKSKTAGWRDGRKVQMIVEMGEATINGETTDGWLRAVSAEILS